MTDKSVSGRASEEERLHGSEEEQDWLESAERDYAWGTYQFFGMEWGAKLIQEVKRLRGEEDNAFALMRVAVRIRDEQIARLKKLIPAEKSHDR